MMVISIRTEKHHNNYCFYYVNLIKNIVMFYIARNCHYNRKFYEG